MSNPLFELKFAKVDCLAIMIRPGDDAELVSSINKRVGKAAGLYTSEPALIDLSQWESIEPPPLEKICKALKKAAINVVGVRHLPAAFEDIADDLGLHIVVDRIEDNLRAQHSESSASVSRESVSIAAQNVSASESVAVSIPDVSALAAQLPSGTILIDAPVRSGQKIYARGGDVVVLGQVSPGAEVIADGHIHVYGPLKGRALAGAGGNRDARIVATSFEPELVAVAGFYMTFEKGFPPGTASHPTQVYLDAHGESSNLRVEPINIR